MNFYNKLVRICRSQFYFDENRWQYFGAYFTTYCQLIDTQLISESEMGLELEMDSDAANLTYIKYKSVWFKMINEYLSLFPNSARKELVSLINLNVERNEFLIKLKHWRMLFVKEKYKNEKDELMNAMGDVDELVHVLKKNELVTSVWRKFSSAFEKYRDQSRDSNNINNNTKTSMRGEVLRSLQRYVNVGGVITPDREREIKPSLVALLKEESFGIDNELLQLPYLSVLKFNDGNGNTIYHDSMHRLFCRVYYLIHPLTHPFIMHISRANKFLKKGSTSMNTKTNDTDGDVSLLGLGRPIMYGLLHNLILRIKINFILKRYESCFEDCSFIANNIDPNNTFVKSALPIVLERMNDGGLISVYLSHSQSARLIQNQNIQESKDRFEQMQHFSKNQIREGRSYSVYSYKAATKQHNNNNNSYLIMFGGKISMKKQNNNGEKSNNINENNYNYYTMMSKIFSNFETKYMLTNDLWKMDFFNGVLSEIIPVSSDNMLPHARWGHTDVIIDNKLWIIGGLFVDVSKFEFEIGSKELSQSCKLGFYLDQAIKNIFEPYSQKN